MFDKKSKRWFINAVLVVAVVAFAGFSLALPLSRAFQGDRQEPEQTEDAAPSLEADLEAQARGYELVLEREPGNETALRGLLQARVQLGDLEGAIAPLEKLVELHPERTEYAVLLGQAKQELGDREGAAQIFRDVLSAKPGDMNALRGLVGLLLQEGRPEAAIGLLEDTLKTASDINQIQPSSVDVGSVQLLLGQVYVELGRDDEAIAIYDEAISAGGDDFRPILSKALLLQAQGRDEEAQPLFSSAEALAPAEYKDEINRLAAGETDDTPTENSDGSLGELSPEETPSEDNGIPDSSGASPLSPDVEPEQPDESTQPDS